MDPANQNIPPAAAEDIAVHMLCRLEEIRQLANVDEADLVGAMFWHSVERMTAVMGPERTVHWLEVAAKRAGSAADGN